MKKLGKMMATVFWDARGIIHIDYLPKQTIKLLCSLIESLQYFKEKNVPI